jgi:TetR/AcrR family transcriptional repressor of nem operon
MKKSKVDTALTKQRIVDAASALFLTKGFAEVAIADVMASVGLTPGGFYRHFASKDELIAVANRAANEQLFQYYDEAVAGMGPMDAIEAFVQLYLYQVQNKTSPDLCPLANLGSELRHTNEHIRSVAMEGHQRLVNAFAALTGELEIPDHVSVADSIVSIIVGAVTLSQVAVDSVVADSILASAQATVHTLLQTSLTTARSLPEAA